MGAGHAHPLYVHEHSVVHRLPPEVKVAAAVAFVVTVALTPREAAWAFGLHALVLLVVLRLSRIRLRFLLPRLLVVAPFLVFAGLLPLIGEGEPTRLFGVTLSREGLWAMWNIAAKATLGAATSILLTATTEVTDILRGFQRLRAPAVLVAIAGFMLRYVDVIAGELRRMRTAMTARAYDPRWLWEAKPLAASAGTLFIRSYERGERIHDAMLARGFTGTMPDLGGPPPTRAEWLVAVAVPLAGLVTLVAAWSLRP